MNEFIVPLVFAALGYFLGYSNGYIVAMRYCTKRLVELGGLAEKFQELRR